MNQGVYTLIIQNGKNQHIQIGKLGNFLFLKGLFVYVGSALGKNATSLEHRLKRHISSTKKLFWHIDFFLSSKDVKILTIIYAFTREKKECSLATTISQIESVQILIPKFGSSDCTCLSHLYYFTLEKNKLIDLLKSAFSKIGLKPII